MEQNPYKSPPAHEPTESDGATADDARPVYLILIAVAIGIVMTAGPTMPFDPHHEWWAERAVIGWFLGFVVGIGWVFVRRSRPVTS
jgi:hypothetical protein